MCTVKVKAILGLAIALATVPLLQAQDDCSDECRINTNLAMVINAPVNTSAQAVGTGWGIAGGIGYNFDRRNAVIGEFMWNRDGPSGGALKPFETALQSTDLRAHTDFYTLTGEYRFELRGHLLGGYLIGGGGWYFRNTWLSREVPSGTGAVCSPAWRWWGYSCTSGIVNPSQPPVTSSTNAFGVNGGAGFTARVGEAPYRLYTEVRYHYAPTKNISTQFITVSVGIRY